MGNTSAPRQAYNRTMLQEFWGRALAQGLGASVRISKKETPYGPCFLLESEQAFALPWPDPVESADRLSRALGLVYGIGPIREQILRAQGYTLFDLARHPRFGFQARFWAEALSARDLGRLAQGVCRWYSASHPLLLALLGLAVPEELVFLDLESLGLSTLPVFLVGIGRLDPARGTLRVRQILACDLAQEMAVLAQALADLPPKPLVVGYNSKAHDWRQLQARLAYYGMEGLPEPAHLDLLFFVRRLWAQALGDCSLPQVERKILGRSRALDIPSEYVPLYYEAFLRTKKPHYLIPILAHNREDVVSLAFLLRRILEEHARPSCRA